MQGKVRDSANLTQKMNQEIGQLKQVILDMEQKRGDNFLEWVENQNKYLKWEENFKPHYLKRYKRGEVVLAHFGFNVGAEYGGMHYATVIKKDSKSNPILNVVPLSSLKKGQTASDLHHEEIYLGHIEGMNGKEAFAIGNQLRPISKIRIYRPKNASQDSYYLSDEQLDAIDEKIKKLYTK